MKRLLLFLAMGLFSFPLFGASAKEATFWQWFQKNETQLLAFEKDRDRIFAELAAAMKRVHLDLTFEFSPVLSDGRREFVISAGGLKAAFPAVEALHAAAPKMEKWSVVKFRPRRSPLNDLEFSGRKIRAADVHFRIFRDQAPGKVGVMLFLDGYRDAEKDIFGQMGFLFLDEALGEYDVETRLGAIVMQGRDSQHFAGARPLADLPQDFDAYFAR
jgi:hypothetical protein